jgi:hypothetical protein
LNCGVEKKLLTSIFNIRYSVFDIKHYSSQPDSQSPEHPHDSEQQLAVWVGTLLIPTTSISKVKDSPASG